MIKKQRKANQPLILQQVIGNVKNAQISILLSK